MRELVFIIVFILWSCNDKVEKFKDKALVLNEVDDRRISYKIDFPDTVYLNEENYGVVNYRSHFDSIITNFGVKETNRYARLIITTKEDINYDLDYLKTIVKDTFGASDNREILFILKFDKKGITYIDGVINDLILIDLHTKDEEGDDLIRLLEDEVRVTKKVVVIDKEDDINKP